MGKRLGGVELFGRTTIEKRDEFLSSPTGGSQKIKVTQLRRERQSTGEILSGGKHSGKDGGEGRGMIKCSVRARGESRIIEGEESGGKGLKDSSRAMGLCLRDRQKKP